MARMKVSAIFSLAFALAACGSPQDRLTDQQANVEQGPIAGAPADNGLVPAPSAPAPVVAANGGAIIYKAGGNEPGWSLTVYRERIHYLGNYGEVKFSEPTPAGFSPGIGRFATQRLRVMITDGPCSDGMSDLVYRHTVRIIADGQPFSGCGGGTVAPGSLANTSWTVTAINGRATGGGSRFALAFTGTEVSGSFGCNRFGGPYDQNGDHVSAPRLTATEMACGDPIGRFEREGLAVLGSNMRLEAASGTSARLVSEAGSIDLKRAI